VTRFVLVFKRIYRQTEGGKERTRWYSEIRKATNLGRALLWLAGYAAKRDWRNSQIEIMAAMKIDGDEVSLVEITEFDK